MDNTPPSNLLSFSDNPWINMTDKRIIYEENSTTQCNRLLQKAYFDMSLKSNMYNLNVPNLRLKFVLITNFLKRCSSPKALRVFKVVIIY